MKRLNFVDRDGNLAFRPFRNCDRFACKDPVQSFASAKGAFNDECPGAEKRGNFWKRFALWLLTPVSEEG